ncbi:Zn-dependent alcohol dehydrogenase [Aquabacterium sp. A7-Y]|uniref:Zn-dependent alcohol dehydrogenase n=1 Tax=Aquabacterium sp. A7-Y TaxID=1349605 RepID=UPI00223E62F0|nr:Zn-dependent alcohol dehydrogenase [Aquabacterium sp. A7-Y]MCW7537327.1 Zn-dependent alcohol dehydrogenase [Aquabacterium sp. A7-Y]
MSIPEARRARAVVCRSIGAPVVVEDILVQPPRAGELMMKVSACGVCHSDLSATDGTIPFPPPLVLGHEGAGVVVAVGEGVSRFAVGDHVVSSFVSMCGKCRYCAEGRPQLCDQAARTTISLPDGSVRTFDTEGRPLGVFAGCGTMAEYATLHTDNVVKIDRDMPLDRAALIGCGVMTGYGAVHNTARVTAGSATAVFGCGGVGLNVVQACCIAGAGTVVAVDTSDEKLEMARRLGATHTVKAGPDTNVVKAVRGLTEGGADYSFECVGRGSVVSQAYGALRKGGTAVVVGVAPPDDTTSLRTATLTFDEKTLKGSYFGSARPPLDFPRLIGLYRQGRLRLDELITREYRVDEAPQAFADLAAGRNARGMIVFD